MTRPGDLLLEIFRTLEAMHGWRGWHWWPAADPFEVIAGAILVQNTSWTNVERALANLRAGGALTPSAMSGLQPERLEELIRPSGQFRQKAKKLRAFLHLVEAHGSLERLLDLGAADLRAQLLATWGIGEETADCIVCYAARKPAFVVDAYTIRLFTRLGLQPSGGTGYGAWQQYFESALAAGDENERKERWARYHALVVMHGKYLCRKRSPRCEDCLLAPSCPSATTSPGR